MMISRAFAGVVAAAVISGPGCGSGGPVAQTSSGVATDKPEPPRDSNEIVVAPRSAPVPDSTDPDERIAYVREGSIWIMNADGGEAEQLSVRAADTADSGPAISTAAAAISYASARDGAQKIYVMSLEDLLPKPITKGANGGDRGPVWSPDGKRIAFVRGAPGDARGIYVVDVGMASSAGVTPTLLVEISDDHSEHAGMPAWSPDGRFIVFCADRREGNGTVLWLIEVATQQLSRLTPMRPGAWFVRDLHPTWSTDGQRIAFASNRHVSSGDRAGDLDIYTIGKDGSGLTRLTDDPVAATEPAFSPDGRRLYFASARGRQKAYEMELYVMAATGGKQRRLTRDERPQNSAPSAGRAK